MFNDEYLYKLADFKNKTGKERV